MSFTLWFMGRPAAGKSTLAKQVETVLRERGVRLENLDGDEIRTNLHPDLGFTKEERAINNRRTAFISKLLNRNGIATIVAMITPFRDAQQTAREIVEEHANFVLIYVKCSVETAANRDPKGLYERAKSGKIDNFTGVSHPFQEPIKPDIIIDAETQSVDECVKEVLDHVEARDIIDETPSEDYEFDITRRREAEIKSRLEDLGYLE